MVVQLFIITLAANSLTFLEVVLKLGKKLNIGENMLKVREAKDNKGI